MQDLNDLFAPKVVIEEKTRVIEEYKPSSEKGKGGVYKSIVRFVPWHKDPSMSLMQKLSCWLVDPITGKGRTIDCPSSIGENSPIRDMFFQLRNSKNVADQEKSKIFSTRQTFCTLVQVIKDENAPELEGRILRYSYGKKIQEKLTAAMKPEFGEPINPYDIFNGKPFAFVITKVSDFNNYDKCSFINQDMPLQWVDNQGKLSPMTVNDDKMEILKFLQDNSADLGKYAYKPWDESTKEFVNNVIAAVTGKNVSAPATPGVETSVIETTTQTVVVENVDADITETFSGIGDISDADFNSLLGDIDDDLPF